MYQEITYKSIIRWWKPVYLIVIGLVDNGAWSGRDIFTERYNVSTVCGNFVASYVQIQRGIGGPHQTKLYVRLRQNLDQPGAQGSCYTTLSAWGKLKVL